jgi:hypothetical protein
MPLAFWPVELFALRINTYLHRKYDRIIVPDNPPGPLSLAGKLSRPESDETRQRAFFSDILTCTQKQEVQPDLDYLVLISGPEPQRTRLEEILLSHIHELEGSVVVLLGSPLRSPESLVSGTCTIRSYVSNDEKASLMNRAKFLIGRSGYTTVMELAELGKRRALFIPTPGQTEQEYLSWYYAKNGWFFSKSQYRISLPEDIATAAHYAGFPDMPGTQANVNRLYSELLAGYLE